MTFTLTSNDIVDGGALPDAQVQRDGPNLFTIGAGNVWAEVQVVDAQDGNPRYVHFGAGRNRVGGPGSMPTD